MCKLLLFNNVNVSKINLSQINRMYPMDDQIVNNLLKVEVYIKNFL